MVIKGLEKLSSTIGLSPVQVFNAVPDALFSVADRVGYPTEFPISTTLFVIEP